MNDRKRFNIFAYQRFHHSEETRGIIFDNGNGNAKMKSESNAWPSNLIFRSLEINSTDKEITT